VRSVIVIEGCNVGPFRELRIEVPKIAVVCGASGSGKSYLLKLVYALIRALNDCRLKGSRSGKDYVDALLSVSRSMFIEIPRHSAGYARISLEVDGNRLEVAYSVNQREPFVCTETTLLHSAQGLYTLLLSEDRLVAHRYLYTFVFQVLREILLGIAYHTITFLEQFERVVIERNVDELRNLVEAVQRRLSSEALRLFRQIPRNVLELSLEIIACHLAWDTVRDVGARVSRILEGLGLGRLNVVESESGGIYLAKAVYEHPTGYRIDVERAPEAIANLWMVLLPIASFVDRYPGIKIVLLDHVEMHSTPPITRYLLNAVLSYAKERNDTYLLVSVHNIDTLTLVSAAVRDLFGSRVSEYVAAYELLPEGIVRRLEVDPRLGIETPKYLKDYMSMLVDTASI